MTIYPFNELSEEQKRNIYQFVTSFEYKGNLGSYDEMDAFYGGSVFDKGCSYFSLWEGGSPAGTLGVVAKEAAVRGEIFMTGISIKESDTGKLSLLLARAFEYCFGIGAASFKLGLNYDRYYLIPEVGKSGFKEVYRYLEMRYSGGTEIFPREEAGCFRSLTADNIREFQQVHNAAFLLAPNGAAIDDSEFTEYLEEYSGSSLAGVYYHGGTAAGVYILKLKGTEGYIEGIGVTPEFHGRGIGKKLLLNSIRVLREEGAVNIGLSVFSSNNKALDMYLKNGFEVEKEHSAWFEYTGSAEISKR